MVNTLLLIVLAPLVASLIAGLFGKRLGRAGAHTVTIAAVALSCALSFKVLYELLQGGPGFDGPVYTWLVSDGIRMEIGFLIAAAGFVYLSVTLHSRTLLFVATAAILAYTGWFTSEHFADSVGWPIALIIFGLVMIGLSALAFRIDRDYVRVSPRQTT